MHARLLSCCKHGLHRCCYAGGSTTTEAVARQHTEQWLLVRDVLTAFLLMALQLKLPSAHAVEESPSSLSYRPPHHAN